MQLSSMTGFARKQTKIKINNRKYHWIWEFKSVNSKNREIKVRLPQWLDDLDENVKGVCAHVFARGSFNISLEIETENTQPQLAVNEDLLNVLSAAVQKIYLQAPDAFAKSSAAELLTINEVVKTVDNQPDEEELKTLKNQLCQSMYATANSLKQDRQKEGRKIGKAMQDIVVKMENNLERLKQIIAGMPEKLRQKIVKQVGDMFKDTDIAPERLEQEILMLVLRADVQEELDRLAAHLKTCRELLESAEPVGRRLDFLCQELNREANTLCSKSMDLEQTKLGMELKALIEQLREQTQNLE